MKMKVYRNGRDQPPTETDVVVQGLSGEIAFDPGDPCWLDLSDPEKPVAHVHTTFWAKVGAKIDGKPNTYAMTEQKWSPADRKFVPQTQDGVSGECVSITKLKEGTFVKVAKEPYVIDSDGKHLYLTQSVPSNGGVVENPYAMLPGDPATPTPQTDEWNRDTADVDHPGTNGVNYKGNRTVYTGASPPSGMIALSIYQLWRLVTYDSNGQIASISSENATLVFTFTAC